MRYALLMRNRSVMFVAVYRAPEPSIIDRVSHEVFLLIETTSKVGSRAGCALDVCAAAGPTVMTSDTIAATRTNARGRDTRIPLPLQHRLVVDAHHLRHGSAAPECRYHGSFAGDDGVGGIEHCLDISRAHKDDARPVGHDVVAWQHRDITDDDRDVGSDLDDPAAGRVRRAAAGEDRIAVSVRLVDVAHRPLDNRA